MKLLKKISNYLQYGKWNTCEHEKWHHTVVYDYRRPYGFGVFKCSKYGALEVE